MAELWGMIRAMQLLVLPGLLSVLYPAHLQHFFATAAAIAALDPLYAERLYEELFTFKETGPINQRFDAFGVGDKNFISNSGSLLVMVLILAARPLAKGALNWICLRFAHYPRAR